MNRRLHKNAKNEMKKFWSLSFFAVCLLVAGAVLQLNGFIHQSSLLSDSKKQIALLSSENDNFEVKLSQSNSLDNFSQYMAAQVGNYEKVDVASVKYVHASGSQLAKK
jgi:hypothetical protein